MSASSWVLQPERLVMPARAAAPAATILAPLMRSKSYTDEYLQQFGEIFTAKGGTTLLGTRAVDLIVDEAGTVTGLVAEDAEGPFTNRCW